MATGARPGPVAGAGVGGAAAGRCCSTLPPSRASKVPVPINDVFFRNDATLTTTYAAAPGDLTTALDLIASGRVQVGDMISHRLPLAETALGFRLTAGASESLKVVIEPQR